MSDSSSTRLPAPSRAPLAGINCPVCGEPMVLWKFGTGVRRHPRCRLCSAVSQRRCREREKLRRFKKTLREALAGGLAAEALLERVKRLIHFSGGWRKLVDALTPQQRVQLAVTMGAAADRATERSEKVMRERELSEAELNSPAMQQDLLNMSLQFVVKHPHRVARALAEHRPKAAVRALLETEKGREALAAAGASSLGRTHETGSSAWLLKLPRAFVAH